MTGPVAGSEPEVTIYTVAIGVNETQTILANQPTAEAHGLHVFTDQDLELPLGFHVHRVKPVHANPRIASRYWKFLGQTDLPTRYSLYVDANITLSPETAAALQTKIAAGAPFAAFAHDRGRRVMDEILYCYGVGKLGLGQVLRLLGQIRHFRRPVFQGGVLFKDREDSGLQQAMQIWWDMVTTLAERDQITGPIALARAGLDWQPHAFPGRIHASDFTKVVPHRLGNFTQTGQARRTDPLQRLIARVMLGRG